MAKKAKATATPALSTEDLFDALAGQAQSKQAANAKKDTCLTPNAALAKAVDEFCASAVIADIAAEKSKADNAEVKRLALEAFTTLWAETGLKPENPTIATKHASLKYQLKSPYKVAVREINLGAVKNALVEANLSPEDADQFAEAVSITKNVTTKAFDELLNGTDDEKEAAKALMQAIKTALTPDQLKLVLVSKPVLTVDTDTLHAKIAQLCIDDAAKLRNVLGVLVPSPAITQPKHDSALEVAQARFAAATVQKEAA